nr:dynein light chain 2, cytoplasmic [Ipomoea batatas]
MSEDSKRNDGGALVAKPPAADDQKYASPPTSSITVSKKVIIKSADMKDDMQKEAVDIAIADLRILTANDRSEGFEMKILVFYALFGFVSVNDVDLRIGR